MAVDTSSRRTRRRYTSPKRAEQAAATRATVLQAAIARFAAQGWSGTGMRDIAGDAGVSVETIYSVFGSKTDLLLAAVDTAVVGDTAPVALGDRPEFAALGRGPRAARSRAAARLAREVNERTHGIVRALQEGAAADAALATRLAKGERDRRTDVAHAVALVAGRTVDARDADGVWAVVSPEVYDLLVERAGWSPADYEDWLADTLGRLLFPRGGSR